MIARRDIALGVAGIVLAAVCVAASLRIPLWTYFPGEDRVTLDFVKMLGPDWRHTTKLYVGFALTTFALYGVALALVWRAPSTPSRGVIFGVPALCALALLPMYPPQAVDMFHYSASSRVLWIYEHNPLVVPPETFPFPIAYSWSFQPSPYGPLWSVIGGIVTVPAQDHALVALFGFKLIAAASLAACTYLIWRVVERHRPGEGALAVVLFAWNPFVLVRVVGNGHNDLVMMALVLVALDQVDRRAWRWAFLWLACSVMVKFVSLLVVPLFLIYAWQHAGATQRQRWRAAIEACAIMAAVAVVAYAPFWEGAATFDTVRGEGSKLITSTAVAIGVAITDYPDDPEFLGQVLTVLRVLFLALAALVWWQSRRSFATLIVGCFTVLALYLLLAAGWFRPWYLLWPVTFAALRPRSWLTPMLLAITFAGSFPDLVEQFRNFWPIPGKYIGQVAAPVVVAFAPIAVTWLTGILVTRGWTLGAVQGHEGEHPSNAPAPAPSEQAV